MKFITILTLACLLPLASCEKSSPPPATTEAPATKSQAEGILYDLHKDFLTMERPISNVRTSTTASPSFYAELKGQWNNEEAGPHKTAYYTLNAFFKDGKWYYEPNGSTAKLLGVSEPDATREGSTFLTSIAISLKLEL